MSSEPPTMSMNALFVGMISTRHYMSRCWFKTYNLYCGRNTESVNIKVDTAGILAGGCTGCAYTWLEGLC